MVLLTDLVVTILVGVLVQRATSASAAVGHTTLATYNAGLFSVTIGNVDDRLSVLIDQVSLVQE